MPKDPDIGEVVEALRDLTRITMALSGEFESTADAVRRLSALGIPPVRLAALLGIPTKQVHAELAKAKSRSKKRKD